MRIPYKCRAFFPFYLLQSAALLAVFVPFLRYNNLLEWDFPGHYAAIWHLKNHLLPWPSGWNPYFYCGYPQGTFYPPLAHYLAALLAFPLGISAAMKGLIFLSLLVLPIAFYIFARRVGLDDLRAAVCATWMTAVLFLSGEMFDSWGFGSDLRSMLNVGLFANTISLLVLFAFFAACGSVIERKNWKLSAFLLGTLLLLHPLSSLVAGVFLVSVVLTQWWQSRGSDIDWKPAAWTALGAGLLASFWLVPYLAYRGYMNPEFVGAHWSPKIQFVVFNGIVLAFASISRLRLRPLAVTYIVLANFIIVGTMWEMQLQFTRFTIYLLFFLPVFLLAQIHSRPLILAMAALAVVVGICGYRYSGLNPRGVPDFKLPDFGRLEGRILSATPPTHLPSFHVNHDLIPIRTGSEETLGLFIESSLNGRFLADLMRSLEPEAYAWGTPTEGVRAEFLGADHPTYIRERLRLFDIRYVYTDLKLENILDSSLAQAKRYVNSYPVPPANDPQGLEVLAKHYNLRAHQLDFYLYPVGAGALVEALPYVPSAPGSDWKLTSRHAFLELRGAPVFIDRAAPEGVREARPGETAELAGKSEQMDRIVIKIRAAQPIPVLVKVGYFPTWKLTINGKPAPVYRASPNLILIFGLGEAVLEYHRSWWEYAGLALTALGAVLLFLF